MKRLPLLLSVMVAISATSCRHEVAHLDTAVPQAAVAAVAPAVDPRAVLARVDAWQEARRAAADRRLAKEARWHQGRQAVYRATGEALWFDRIDAWIGHSTDPLASLPDAVDSLRAAQVQVAFHSGARDTLTTPVPASWDAWRDAVLPRAANSARLLGALPTLGMVATIQGSGNGNAKRGQWFSAQERSFSAAWSALVDPATGLIGTVPVLADQGEAALGLALMLNDVPRLNAEWMRHADELRRLAAALIARQRSAGGWATDLGAGAADLPGTALVVGALAQGVDQGILDAAVTGPALARAWAVIGAGIDAQGQVRGLAKQTPDDSGAVLLAAAGMIRLQRLLDHAGRPLPASDSPLVPACGLEVHPLASQLLPVVERAGTATIQPTGLGRRDYLRVIARQVGFFRQHQAADGRIIDPVKKVEYHYATPCYAHAAATLVASGADRSPELLDSAMRALDAASGDLLARCLKQVGNIAPGSDVNTSDFYARPVLGAYLALKPIAPAERVAIWEQRLSALDPVKTFSAPNGSWGNWTACNLWGEYLRQRCGWQQQAYIDHNLDIQRWHATPLGFYFEGHGPFAYDGFGRYFLVGILFDGYRGPQADFWRDRMWCGAWSSLAVQSPAGEMPAGGRSAHHIWNEAQVASIFEMYATAYAKAGRPVEAGMFKRGALLALRSIDSWIAADGSGQVVKNWYPPEARHGYMSYSHFASYNMSAMSMLASAWEAADDAVSERAAPADLGGILVQAPELTSVIAHADGAYVQYLTKGDQHHDPTGLIRVHLRGSHPQLGPSSGVGEKEKWAIGPRWKPTAGAVASLATVSEPRLRVESAAVSAASVSFTVVGQSGSDQVSERIALEHGQVRVLDRWQSAAPGSLSVSFPALLTDGRTETALTLAGARAELRRPDAGGVAVEILSPQGIAWTRSGLRLDHPNGVVEPLLAETAGPALEYSILPLPR